MSICQPNKMLITLFEQLNTRAGSDDCGIGYKRLPVVSRRFETY